MGTNSLSPFSGECLAPVLRLLSHTLPKEAITEASFTRKVLLDPNFDPDGALVAWDAYGEAIGFLLALTRRRPLEDGPDDSGRGWITLFTVTASARRQGIGTRLFDRAEEYLRQRACTTISISPYAPNYWTPGVDEAAYPEALTFLKGRGYAPVSRPLSMDVSLTTGGSMPDWGRERSIELAQQGIVMEIFQPRYVPALTDFLRRGVSGDWQRYLRETMLDIVAGRRTSEELMLAFDGETLIGFAQSEGERFGPFGVAGSARGRGIGAVLLFQALDGMQARGHQNAWFLWTDDRTADRLYRGAGFCESRRYAVMRKILT